MMYSPSPVATTKRPLGEWARVWGYISEDPSSLTERGSRAPSLIWSSILTTLGRGGTSRFDDGSFDVRVFCPYDFAGVVHGYSGFFTAHLDHDDTLIESHSDFL